MTVRASVYVRAARLRADGGQEAAAHAQMLVETLSEELNETAALGKR